MLTSHPGGGRVALLQVCNRKFRYLASLRNDLPPTPDHQHWNKPKGGGGGVLTIYVGEPEIPAGKSNGVCHSIWEASENIDCDLKWCCFSALLSLSS